MVEPILHRGKKILIPLLGCIAVYLLVNELLSYRLSNYLKSQELEGIFYNYDKIKISLKDGSATIINPIMVLNDSLGANFNGKLQLESIKIKDFSYLTLLFMGDLNLDAIELNSPTGVYYLGKSIYPKKSKRKDTIDLKELDINIDLGHLEVNNANIKMYDQEKDSLSASVKDLYLDVRDIKVDNNTLSNSLPFTCENYQIDSDSLFLKVGLFEHLRVGSIRGNYSRTMINDLSFNTKYSRSQLSKILSKERDHFKIRLDSIAMKEISLKNLQEDLLEFGANNISIYQPNVHIYRNKLLKDSKDKKPMYSQILRNSKLQIAVDTLVLHEAKLVYSEKTKKKNKPGSIFLDQMKINMIRLGNAYQKPTNIDMTGRFMKSSDIQTSWSFNTQNTQDDFTFYGTLGYFDVNNMNTFTESSLNVHLQGVMKKLDFKIYGNRFKSNGTLTADYDNLVVSLLRENSGKKRKLLSSVLNMFVSNSSKKKNSNYETVEYQIERNPEKSFFSFIIANIKEGMKKTML